MRLFQALVVPCVSILLASCGRSALESGAGSVVGGTSAEFASVLPSAWCQYYVTCGFSPSVDQCLRDYRASFVLDFVADIDGGRVVYNSSKAVACAKAVTAAACSYAATRSPEGEQARRCAGVFEGTVPAGGDCVRSIECASNNCLKPSWCGGMCCLGICAASSDIGATCSDPEGCSTSNTYCTLNDSAATWGQTGTCQALAGQGQPCSFDLACQAGLGCAPRSWTCEPTAKNGEPCALDGPMCDDWRSFCTGTPGSCQPRDPPGSGCWYTSTSTESCVGYSDCTNGICVARPGIGEPCSVDAATSRDSCFFGACIDGTCQPQSETPCTMENAIRPDAGARESD